MKRPIRPELKQSFTRRLDLSLLFLMAAVLLFVLIGALLLWS